MPLPDDLTVARYMEHYLPRALERHGERLDGVETALLFRITGEGGGDWTVTIRERKPSVSQGAPGEPRCTFEATAADWLALVRGELQAPVAFMTGRVRISGDYFHAMKLGTMFLGAMASLGR